jgi:hypothetical protein
MAALDAPMKPDCPGSDVGRFCTVLQTAGLGSWMVAKPITAVVPTLDGPVLTVLAGTTSPCLSEIARLSGRGSISGVRKVRVGSSTGCGLDSDIDLLVVSETDVEDLVEELITRCRPGPATTRRC